MGDTQVEIRPNDKAVVKKKCCYAIQSGEEKECLN